MMLAALDPDDTGPIVINGAPMSYWGGAGSDGEGDNPMRYAGGMLGGTWLASLASRSRRTACSTARTSSQNFENLNPANTFWDKYYNLFANVDTEPARFLEFERWWGGFFLMNREEIEWITQNLFVGNKLWQRARPSGRRAAPSTCARSSSPIILFASLGDNITPPQQAFNWVADLYRTTEEIKAHGQVIVGLMHQERRPSRHLRLRARSRKKEHTQIVSVLKSIETLPPGLYGMEIRERRTPPARRIRGEFVELRLEEVAPRLNRFEREDEKPFEAVAAVSDFNQRAYELFGRPWCRRPRTSSSPSCPRLPSAALAALGVLRLQPLDVAAGRRAGGEGAAPGPAGRPSAAPRRGERCRSRAPRSRTSGRCATR